MKNKLFTRATWRNVVVPVVALATILTATTVYAATTIGTSISTGGSLTVDGSATLGDAVADGVILKGRVSTSTSNGAALTLDSTYLFGEGQELRYKVTDWTGVGDAFRGMYLRAENGVDASTKGVYGAEVYATANDTFDTGNLQGLLSYAYLKGTGAKTVGPAYGVHGELTFDAGQSTQTITTEAAPALFKITGGVTDDYTKLQGVIVRSGDMDGASRTYGNAILVQDDANMAGTITWTRGLKLSSPSTADIELQNGETIDNATNGVVTVGTSDLFVTPNGSSNGRIWVHPTLNERETGNYINQAIKADVTIGSTFGASDSSDEWFASAIRSRLMGSNLTGGNNTMGALEGSYYISGTNASTYPKGAVLAEIGNNSTTADGAFVAYTDGDVGTLNSAGAAFKVMNNNNAASGSKFTYGLDLFDAGHDGLAAVTYGTADIRLVNGETISNSPNGVVAISGGIKIPKDAASATNATSGTTPTGITCDATTLGTMTWVDDTDTAGAWLWLCEQTGASSYAWEEVGP